jgi:hypothetical protein
MDLVNTETSFCFFLVFNIIFLEESTTALSVVHLSPLGSQVSFSTSNATRIENIVDWESIAKKYRALIGELDESGSNHESGLNIWPVLT